MFVVEVFGGLFLFFDELRGFLGVFLGDLDVELLFLGEDNTGIRDVDSRGGEDRAVFPEQVTLNLETVRLFAGRDDFDGDVGVFVFGDAFVEGAGEDRRDLFLDGIELLLEELFDEFDGDVIREIDVHDREGGFAGEVHDVLDVAVIHDFDVARAVQEFGGADTNLNDFAAEPIDGDDFARVEFVLKDDEHPGDDVGDQGLGAKANDEGENANGGNQGFRVDPTCL